MTLALMMMVRNEAHVIERAIGSAIGHVDAVVITDTGSTDGTQGVIDRYCRSQGIVPTVVQSDWKGWEGSRNEMFRNARQSGCDYALMLDADDVLEVAPGSPKPTTADGYMIRLKKGPSSWSRTDILRLDRDWKWAGADHPIADLPGGTRESLPGWKVRIIGDGGRTVAQANPVEKWEAGAKALEKAVADEPTNQQAWFYLAQDYHDAGNYEEAIRCYAHRVSMGGWEEQVWFSQYRIAQCYEYTKREPEIAGAYLEAYRFRPTRVEPLVDLARYFRNRNAHDASLLFGRIAAAIPEPTSELYLSRDDYYEWQAKYECWHAEWRATWGNRETALRLAYELLADAKVPEQFVWYVKSCIAELQKDPPLVVVTHGGPGIEQWVARCIASVMQQSIKCVHAIMLGDRSVYETAVKAKEALGSDCEITCTDRHSFETAIELIRRLPPEAIIVWVDADDWLLRADALEIVRNAFRDPECWLSYGSFAWWPKMPEFVTHVSTEYPPDVVARNAYRQDHWRASHLRVSRAGLMQKIRDEDLRDLDGKYLFSVIDQALVLPQLEMAGGHVRRIEEPLLVYNCSNPQSPNNPKCVRPDKDELIAKSLVDLRYLRAQPPYERLDERPW